MSHGDGVASLASGAGAQLGVDHHHVPVPHIHQRTAEGKAVDRSLDRHPALALENFAHVKGRLECRRLSPGVAQKLDLELARHDFSPLATILPLSPFVTYAQGTLASWVNMVSHFSGTACA